MYLIQVTRQHFASGNLYSQTEGVKINAETMSDLYRYGSKNYGRCLGKVNHDTGRQSGYRFVKVHRDDPHNPCTVTTRFTVVEDPEMFPHIDWIDLAQYGV